MDYDDLKDLLASVDLEEVERQWAVALESGKTKNLRDAVVLVMEERCMALATNEDERHDAEAAVGEWGDNHSYDFISEVEAKFRRDIVECGNPSSMVSSIWGLQALVLDRQGFVYNYGYDAPVAEFTVWASWKPSDDEAAYEQAVSEAWAASWDEIGLPPFMGEYWTGDGPMVLKAIDSLISRNREARGLLSQNLPDLRQEALQGASDRSGTCSPSPPKTWHGFP